MKTHGPESGQPFTRSMVNVHRFWARVDRSNETGCWLWIGTLGKSGYGYFSVKKFRKGPVHAHRVAYVIAHGSIPAGKSVMHSCDNPACVNSAHLSLGSHADNMRDAVRKGRTIGSRDRTCERGHRVAARSGPCVVCKAQKRRRQQARKSVLVNARARDGFVSYFQKHIAPLLPATFGGLLAITDERRATVFARYFGTFGFTAAHAERIGSDLGVCRERVRQLRNDVLALLGVSREVRRGLPVSAVWKEHALIATRSEVTGRVA